MTGNQLAAIRKQLGLSAYAMGQALGYAGDRNTIQVSMARIEKSEAVPATVARLAQMFKRHGVPDEFLSHVDS